MKVVRSAGPDVGVQNGSGGGGIEELLCEFIREMLILSWQSLSDIVPSLGRLSYILRKGWVHLASEVNQL